MSYPDYKLRLSARARNDFKSILRYTGEKWGRGQISVYGELLNKALDTIRLNPDIGHVHEELPPTLKTYLVGSHIIVYRFGEAAGQPRTPSGFSNQRCKNQCK